MSILIPPHMKYKIREKNLFAAKKEISVRNLIRTKVVDRVLLKLIGNK